MRILKNSLQSGGILVPEKINFIQNVRNLLNSISGKIKDNFLLFEIIFYLSRKTYKWTKNKFQVFRRKEK